MTQSALIPPASRSLPPRSPAHTARRWLGPGAVVLVAAFLRLWRLDYPHALVYDEHFYVKDAYTLSRLGYEGTWPKSGDASFDAGHFNVYSTTAEAIAHPPLGKWIMSLSIDVFGVQNPYSWRLMDALVGILAVVLVIAIGNRLFHSLAFGTIAGGLLAIDGSAIVLSRVGLLDNFVMFFALLGVAFMLLDRDWSTRRLDRRLSPWRESGAVVRFGPTLWGRPWLVAAGLAFGACAGVKWTGFFFLVAFFVYSVAVDAFARQRSGIRLWHLGALLKQAPANFVLMVPIALAAYVASWSGWFATSGGLYRRWADQPGNALTGGLAWVPHTIQSFWHVQQYIYTFGTAFAEPDAYTSPPIDWLFLIRPVAMYSDFSGRGQKGCEADSCTVAINAISNPLLWWAASAALFVLLLLVLFRRNWKAGFILMGVVAGYVPWLLLSRPTVFQTYTIAFEPFMVLALAMVLQLCWGRRAVPGVRARLRRIIVVVFLVFCVALSLYFLPLWLGIQEPTWFINAHYWLPSWA